MNLMIFLVGLGLFFIYYYYFWDLRELSASSHLLATVGTTLDRRLYNVPEDIKEIYKRY